MECRGNFEISEEALSAPVRLELDSGRLLAVVVDPVEAILGF